MRRRPDLILVVALALLAGCGSSSDSSSPPTRAEFIARADALCQASKAKQAPLRKRLGEVARTAREEEQDNGGVSNPTRRELAQTLSAIVATAEAGLSDVQALEPPEADSDLLEAIFQTTESAFRTSDAYGAALEDHEDARAQAIAEKGNVQTHETAVLAERYGFKVCGSQPPAS